MSKKRNQIAGIIPGAGLASRLGQMPISKEIFPIGYEGGRVKVVANQLMDEMAEAGASQIHFVIRNGKWDIPAFFESKYREAAVCYHLIEYGYGVPFTINQALPFVMDKTVVFGFPDILFKPQHALKTLVETLDHTDAEITLGLFPVAFKAKFDRVVLSANNDVESIELKPEMGSEHDAWIVAAWKPEFSNFLHSFVEDALKTKSREELDAHEIQISSIIDRAIKTGMKVRGVVFENGACIDIGTSGELKKRTSFNF